MGNLSSYISLLFQFRDVGYRCSFFNEKPIKAKKQLFLRHDVDFDLQKAWNMARAEQEEGFTSTYFFLLTSDSYNLLVPKNSKIIREIREMGHEISLHFDPKVYKNVEEGLKNEIQLFKEIFKSTVQIISFHRPVEEYLNGSKILDGKIAHTYEDRFFKEINYVSDSSGSFKYGHPLETEEFVQHKTFQLLTHPILWDTKGDSNVNKLEQFICEKEEELSRHIAANCIPWKLYKEL